MKECFHSKKHECSTWERNTSLYVPISLKAIVNLVMTGPTKKRFRSVYEKRERQFGGIEPTRERSMHISQNKERIKKSECIY
jgi:hypothetical protein